MQILSVHGCDSTLVSSCNGLYVLVENELVNGMPLYKKEGGTKGQEGADALERVMWYTGTDYGRWLIGPASSKGQDRGYVGLPEDAPLPHLGTKAWTQTDGTVNICWKKIQAIKCVETPKVGIVNRFIVVANCLDNLGF